MSRHKLSLTELRAKLENLQYEVDCREQEMNISVGAWVRKETGLDTLEEIQSNFIIIPQKNKSQDSESGKKIPQLTNSNSLIEKPNPVNEEDYTEYDTVPF